jgi:ABC-type multidrug transport system fused ATPase/permease subunit
VTIADSDKIMVLEQGELVEFDEPQALLAKSPPGEYGKLMQQSQDSEQQSQVEVDQAGGDDAVTE